MIISCVNTYVRIVYYIIEHFTESNSVEWFDLSVWYVYVCVIIAGLLGVPLGSWVEPKINQAQYNAIIQFLPTYLPLERCTYVQLSFP